MALTLSSPDRARIAAAIAAAERGHRGEIVVHVEPRVFGDHLKYAARLFRQLGVDKTKDDTGVLLLVATSQRRACVWAGTGIARGADPVTWKPVFDALAAGNADVNAIVEAIAALGRILTTLAPGADVHGNELGDGASA